MTSVVLQTLVAQLVCGCSTRLAGVNVFLSLVFDVLVHTTEEGLEQAEEVVSGLFPPKGRRPPVHFVELGFPHSSGFVRRGR